MALNVLIVDDSSVMRAMIRRTLNLCGIPVGDAIEAANGAEALQQLDSNWVDLAMIDINMPVMNGIELIDEIRKNPEIKDLPVIVVSTESSKTQIEILQQKGAHFVHKPFTPEELRQIIVDITGVSIGEEQACNSIIPGGGQDF